MSTYILSACWSLSGMSSSQKLVLISLADQANDDGVCWPSIRRMSERTCLSERAIRDAVSWLSASGILSVDHRYNSSNVYTISVSKYDPDNANIAPPAPSAPPAPFAGTPCAKRRTPLRQVPTNLHITYIEPSSTTASDGDDNTPSPTIQPSTRDLVTMDMSWRPSKHFSDAIKMAGKSPDELTNELLAKFILQKTGEKATQGAFDKQLLRWVIGELKTPRNGAQEAAGPSTKGSRRIKNRFNNINDRNHGETGDL